MIASPALRAVTLALLSTALAAALPAVARAAGLPARPAPAGFHSLDVAGGGRILEAVPAGTTSAGQALRAGVRLTTPYFDGAPRVLSIVRSADGRVTIAHFSATLLSQGVSGLLVAVYDGAHERIALLFDRTRDAGASMNRMIATLEHEGANAGGGGGGVAALRPMVSPDHSVLAALPATWTTKQFGNGELVAVGPDGAEVDQEIAFSLLDPRSSMTNAGFMRIPYEPSPTHIFAQVATLLTRSQGKTFSIHFDNAGPVQNTNGLSVQHIAGTNTINGVVSRFEGEIALSPPNNNGGYSLDIKLISAPASAYKRDLPTMVAVYNSYRVDQQREAQITSEYVQFTKDQAARGAAQMAAVRAQNTATFNASMANAAQVQDSIDRSTAGTVRYLSDTNVIAGPNGAHATVSDAYADAVVRANPQQFHIVPMTDYRKGVDF